MGGRKGVPHNHHGMSRSRLYKAWTAMMNRCGHYKASNPAAIKYYVDRGIVVCEDWRHFPTFAAWAMDNGYADDLSLDRIDSDGNYEPANCQWICLRDNIRKRAGVTLTMEIARDIRRRLSLGERPVALAAELGVTANTIYRIRSGARWAEAAA